VENYKYCFLAECTIIGGIIAITIAMAIVAICMKKWRTMNDKERCTSPFLANHHSPEWIATGNRGEAEKALGERFT